MERPFPMTNKIIWARGQYFMTNKLISMDSKCSKTKKLWKANFS